MPQGEAVGCHPMHADALDLQLLQVSNHPCQHVHVDMDAERLIQVRGAQPLSKVGNHICAAAAVPAGVSQIV